MIFPFTEYSGPTYPTWLRPSSQSQLGCKAKKIPCCVGPPVDASTASVNGVVAAAETYVQREKHHLIERIVPGATSHVGLVEGREHVWPLVVGRTTHELQSGAVISRDRADSLSPGIIHRPIQGGPKYIRVVFHLKSLPSEDELERHVPAIPVRLRPLTALSCFELAAAKAASHPCELNKGWVATNAMVARSVKPAEPKWNTDAQERMQEDIDRLELREVWNLKEVRQWADVSADAKRRNEKATWEMRLGFLWRKVQNYQRTIPTGSSRAGMLIEAIR